MLRVLAACFALASAEIGLTVQSGLSAINGLPLRIVDGRLTVGGDGPIFQGIYDDGSLVLSERVVSQDAVGSGIGLSDTGLLIVTFNSSTTFYDRDGWLEYDGEALFQLLPTGRAYDVYASRPDLDAEPVMLQFASLIYPNGTQSSAGALTDRIASTIVLSD